MGLTSSIFIYVAGVAASALLFKALHKRVSVAVAEGLAIMVLLLSLYPLVQWMSVSHSQSFMKYALLSFAGALASALIIFILQRRD